jgi:putative MATE family efflux protein
VEPLYTFTDTAIVGHLGAVPLGALAVATSILNVALFGCGFLTMATTPRVAFHLARGESTQAGRAAVAAFWLAGLMGLALAAAIAGSARPLAELFGARGEVLTLASGYLRIAAPGIPFYLAMLAGNGYSRGISDTRTPLEIIAAANGINVALELGFVYGLGWGTGGSALGTTLAQVAGGIWFLAVTRQRLRDAHSDWRPDRREVEVLLRAAGALVVRTLALMTALSGSTAVAARLGVAVLGAQQIGQQTWLLVGLSLDALAVPAQVLVAEALGVEDRTRAVAAGSQMVRLGLAVSVGLGLLTVIAAPHLPALFTRDPTIRREGALAIAAVGATLPITSVAFTLDGALVGAADFRFLRRAMILALLAFLPGAALTLADHRVGIVGIWAALACWLAARAGQMAWRWRSGRWARD